MRQLPYNKIIVADAEEQARQDLCACAFEHASKQWCENAQDELAPCHPECPLGSESAGCLWEPLQVEDNSTRRGGAIVRNVSMQDTRLAQS